ncbi:MAG: alpha/beta hydrolase family protein [Oligosphaeraceae bacterium]
MKKRLEVMGIAISIPVVLFLIFLVMPSCIPMTPNDYTKTVKTGGEIEGKYLAIGNDNVLMARKNVPGTAGKNFYIFYPEELNASHRKYPVVVMLNGTGVLPKKYKALFEHLASWGFVVVGNDDPSTGFGKSAEETMDLIASENSNADSLFHGKLDLANIGITGHSQGGAGVLTAISMSRYSDKYRTAVALSPTHEETAHKFGWKYDLEKIKVPTLMMAGVNDDFETRFVIPLEKMTEMYDKIPSSKAMLRRIDAGHGQMLYSADGYVTAWFMWQLQGDQEAGKAFIGNAPEIRNNKLYRDIAIDIDEPSDASEEE